jgi:hypothetical protein
LLLFAAASWNVMSASYVSPPVLRMCPLFCRPLVATISPTWFDRCLREEAEDDEEDDDEDDDEDDEEDDEEDDDDGRGTAGALALFLGAAFFFLAAAATLYLPDGYYVCKGRGVNEGAGCTLG